MKANSGLYVSQTRRRDKIMSDEHFSRWCGIRDCYDPDERFAGFLTREEHLAAVNGGDGTEVQTKVSTVNRVASAPTDGTGKALLY